MAHLKLGAALGLKDDWNSAIPEFRDAARLESEALPMAHVGLGHGTRT